MVSDFITKRTRWLCSHHRTVYELEEVEPHDTQIQTCIICGEESHCDKFNLSDIHDKTYNSFAGSVEAWKAMPLKNKMQFKV
jgi:hypothetical protein